MITNVRSRVLHDAPLHEPDHGYVMVYDEGTKIFQKSRPISSTKDFFASDFTFQDQIKLGMEMKPSMLEDSRLHSADSVNSAVRNLQLSEFEAMQKDSLNSESYADDKPEAES